MVVADNFGLFVTGVLIVVGIAVAGDFVRTRSSSEATAAAASTTRCMLFSLAGMMLMATATDLLVIFLALEVLSLAVYVLTGIRRDSPAAVEAALKYFLLGAFSSAFFLYGIALHLRLDGHARGSTGLAR